MAKVKSENKFKTMEIGAKVLQIEGQAILSMAEQLPSAFGEVVETILNLTGRVVVSGVGKSGHVGRKIAATLASTGTTASFVHSTEASHGDLGMLTKNDFCVLISNSGETEELMNILNHTKRFGIQTAGISSGSQSTLMTSVNFPLLLPSAPEACPIGMAPTTSTTLMMALGDALAVALMEKRNFKAEDFKVFHPGGRLGAKLTTVRLLMRNLDEMALCSQSMPMHEVVLKMTETGFGLAVIVDEMGKLAGVITDGDLRRNFQNLFDLQIADLASPNPVCVAPDEPIASAIEKMEANKTYSILVVEDQGPIGMIRMHDVLRAGMA